MNYLRQFCYELKTSKTMSVNQNCSYELLATLGLRGLKAILTATRKTRMPSCRGAARLEGTERGRGWLADGPSECCRGVSRLEGTEKGRYAQEQEGLSHVAEAHPGWRGLKALRDVPILLEGARCRGSPWLEGTERSAIPCIRFLSIMVAE